MIARKLFYVIVGLLIVGYESLLCLISGGEELVGAFVLGNLILFPVILAGVHLLWWGDILRFFGRYDYRATKKAIRSEINRRLAGRILTAEEAIEVWANAKRRMRDQMIPISVQSRATADMNRLRAEREGLPWGQRRQ